jgi:hypothetical protein
MDFYTKLLKRLLDELHRRGLTVKEQRAFMLERSPEERAVRVSQYRCPTFAMGEPRFPLDSALSVVTALEDEELARNLSLRNVG